jgi:hypothetical protein
MENVGIFYVHLVYFTAIKNNLRPFGIILWSFGIFPPVLVCCTQLKSGNTGAVCM